MWAGSSGTPPCTGTPISAGSLTSAAYTASYSYDALNRLTSAPTLGSYSYGTTPLHAATSATSGGTTQYSASYDAAGDMVCRAPSSATTCSGTPTGQQMTYDAERRVNHWQSAPGGSPSSSADYLYDGSGQRIEQVDTSSGASTKVYYLFGGLEELDASGSMCTLTKYYSVSGFQIGVNVGGTISYLASDGLGSVSEALSTTGSVMAAQLYGPYGGVRYSSGTMPTAKGFTGHYGDALTGLDYYGARYYDPALGQFTSADTKQGPNRFAYVAGNPETLTDPSGHWVTEPDGRPVPCDSCNYDDAHIHIRPTGTGPGCGAGGGGFADATPCTSATKHGATVGKGERVTVGATPGSDEYQWCTSYGTCVYANGYYGANLKAYIAQLQDQLSSDKGTLDTVQRWNALLSLLGGVIVAAVVTFIVALAKRSIGAGISAGTNAGGWTVATVAAALEFDENYLEGQISDLQRTTSGLQAAYDAGESVWYVSGPNGYTNTSDDNYVLGDGPTPGFEVRYQVGLVLWHYCENQPDGSGTSPQQC